MGPGGAAVGLQLAEAGRGDGDVVVDAIGDAGTITVQVVASGGDRASTVPSGVPSGDGVCNTGRADDVVEATAAGGGVAVEGAAADVHRAFVDIEDSTTPIAGCVTRESAVADVHPAIVVDAASVGGGCVTGEGAVVHVHRGRAALIVDATTVEGCVIGERAIANVQRASVADATTALLAGCVAGESAVADGQRAIAEDATAIVAAGIAIGDGYVGQRQVAAAGHVKDAELRRAAVAAALDGGAVAVDGDLAGDGGQAAVAVGGVLHGSQRVGAASRQVNGIGLPVAVGIGDGLDEFGDVAADVELCRAGHREQGRAQCNPGQQRGHEEEEGFAD